VQSVNVHLAFLLHVELIYYWDQKSKEILN
jgi:hypothetical protein